jgi:hypothetical protein
MSRRSRHCRIDCRRSWPRSTPSSGTCRPHTCSQAGKSRNPHSTSPHKFHCRTTQPPCTRPLGRYIRTCIRVDTARHSRLLRRSCRSSSVCSRLRRDMSRHRTRSRRRMIRTSPSGRSCRRRSRLGRRSDPIRTFDPTRIRRNGGRCRSHPARCHRRPDSDPHHTTWWGCIRPRCHPPGAQGRRLPGAQGRCRRLSAQSPRVV